MKTINNRLKPVKIDLTNANSWRKVCALESASNAIVRRMDGKQLLAIRTPESASVLSVFFN
jgi:hypothetical protein